MAFARSLNCSRVGESYIEVVGVTAGTGIIDITYILCNVSYLRSRGSFCYLTTVLGVVLTLGQQSSPLKSPKFGSFGWEIPSTQNEMLSFLFARNHLELSLNVSDMRRRKPGLITGRALRLSVPLGWRPSTYKSASVLGTGRVRQILRCRASSKLGAGINRERTIVKVSPVARGVSILPIQEWRVGEA